MNGPNPPLVRIAGLVKSFGFHRVLDGIDLTITKGEVLVIMGPSGSGKSTLLRSVNALERPDAGEVEVSGTTLAFGVRTAPSPAAIRRIRLKTAMVFQAFNLFPHRTALENVIEGLISVRGTPRQRAVERGRALLARMGLSDKADVYPSRLSGGQKQRVAIARGLAMDPELMLFDEPTSALDPELRDDVLAVMKELAASGMTMMVVTHELQFARDAADRIVFLKGGTILKEGPPSAFFEAPNSSEIQKFFALVRA